MDNPLSETPLISWRCYEPAGHRIELSESDLVQHTLLVGSTGSGKSTLLIDATRQLIAHQAELPGAKPGLLVLDAKADDLVARLQDAALQAGRAGDVLVFGPEGDHAFDLFGGLHSLNDVNRVTRQVLLGTETFGQDNAYWWQSTAAMLNAAFALLVAAEQPITFASTVEFLRRWFLTPNTPPVVLAQVRRVNARGGRRHPAVATALDQVQLWQTLDSRTRSNLQSCLLNVLQPLLSSAATRCFTPQRGGACSPAQAATDGRLCVVSINAMAEPDLARFYFRLAKQTFFDAVQQSRARSRLCGIVIDEFPLVVTPEDVEQLATVRSKRCFVIAATQGLHSLSERIGVGQARALVNHFNTILFLRTREAETAVQAHIALGTRKERLPGGHKDEAGGLLGLMVPPNNEPAVTEVPVCPIGALGQLSPHQAYVIFTDGRRTEFPVWFVPWFEVAQPSSPPAPTPPSKFTAAHVQQLMQAAGFSPQWGAAVVVKASALSRRPRGETIREVSEFFRSKGCVIPAGLDTLPDCWLAALPGTLRSLSRPHWTHFPSDLDRVAVEEGLLLLGFAREQSEGGTLLTVWDRMRIAINAAIYPSRWRPLHRLDHATLRRLHPELQRAPDASQPPIS